ncbi:MAG: hypothetical protein QOJ65_2558, partial [Fimbriimonadaceae bacterium]|nr:hypothetical protein [Fimbriimonadaceae bacterium]
MKLTPAFLFAIAAALVLPALAGADEKHSEIIFKLKDGSRNAEIAARAVKGIGRLEARKRHQSDFVLEVKEGLTAQQAILKLRKNAEIVAAVIRFDAAAEGGEGENEEGQGKGMKYDRLDALRYWFEQRAYPFGKIDRDAYQRAVIQRKEMPAEKIGSTDRIHPTTTTNVWEFLGPKNLGGAGGTTPFSGRVNGLVYNPTNLNIIYAATASGGVWKTTDAGINWTPLSDSWPFMYTSCLAISPDGNTLYCGTGDFNTDYAITGVTFGSGVMKSTDGGATWTQLGLADGFNNYSVSKIIVDPETPSTVTISLGRGRADTSFSGVGYVYRSTNSGATWTKVLNVNDGWSDLSCSAISGGVRYYYAVSQNGKLYRSADRGATWALLTSPALAGGNIVRIAAHPTTQTIAYLLDSNASKVFKTGNAGASWIDVTSNMATTNDWGQSWYDATIAVSQNAGQDFIYIGLIDV